MRNRVRDERTQRGISQAEIAAALVGWGIDSMSVNPSSLIDALKVAADAEHHLAAAE